MAFFGQFRGQVGSLLRAMAEGLPAATAAVAAACLDDLLAAYPAPNDHLDPRGRSTLRCGRNLIGCAFVLYAPPSRHPPRRCLFSGGASESPA